MGLTSLPLMAELLSLNATTLLPGFNCVVKPGCARCKGVGMRRAHRVWALRSHRTGAVACNSPA